MKKILLLACTAFVVCSGAVYAKETPVTMNQDDQSIEAQNKAEPSPLTLYNFKTKAEDTIPDPQSLSVEKGKEFIPPLPVAQQLYLKYVKDGAKPLEAITYTYVQLRKAVTELQQEQQGQEDPVDQNN